MEFTPLLWLAGAVALVALVVETLTRSDHRGHVADEFSAVTARPIRPPYIDYHTPAWMAPFAQVYGPEQLPTFAHVIGLDLVKRGLEDVAGPVLRRPPDEVGPPSRATLLWGRRGSGKAVLATALAGHFGARLVHVSARFLVTSGNVTQQPRLAMLVRYAQTHTPSVFLIDDLEILTPDPQAQVAFHDVLNELKRRDRRARLVVVATLTTSETFAPSRHVQEVFDPVLHVHEPDAFTRERLATRLLTRHRMVADDIPGIVRATSGLTRAELIHAIHRACARAQVDDGPAGMVDLTHVVAAAHEPERAPSVAQLALSVDLKVQLDQVLRRLGDPHARLGVVLVGRDGTGKTTLARALAASSRRRLVAVTEEDTRADVLEARVSEAINQRPSVLLIDESPLLEAPEQLALRLGCLPGPHPGRVAAAITRALAHPGVAVIATTQRDDLIDPRLRRMGGLDMSIAVGSPDLHACVEMIREHLRAVRLRHLTPGALAERLEGLTPGEIGTVLADAVRSAERRMVAADPDEWADEPVVTPRDVWRALQLLADAA